MDPKQLVWLFTFALCLLDWRRFLASDADLATHIAMGRRLLASGFPIDTNPLTFMADEPPVLHEWVFEVTMALLDSIGGLGLPLVVMAAAAASVPASVYVILRRRGVDVALATAAAGLSMIGMNVHLLARPHVLSLVALAWWWKWISDEWQLSRVDAVDGRSHARRFVRFAPIVLAAVWANVHGGFLQALAVSAVVAGAELVGAISARHERWGSRRVALVVGATGALALAATLLNPSGPFLHEHLIVFLTDRAALAHVDDFRALDLSIEGLGVLAIWFLIVLIVAAPLVVARRQLRWSEVATALLAVVAALASVRGLPALALLGGLIAAEVFHRWLTTARQAGRDAEWMRRFVVVSRRLEPSGPGTSWRWSVVLSLVAALVAAVVRVPLEGPRVPAAALDALRARPDLIAARGFTDFLSGGYVLYVVPVERVFIHPLNAAYPPALFALYSQLQDGDVEWAELARRHNFGWALADSARVRMTIAADPCWRSLASDSAGELFEREVGCER